MWINETFDKIDKVKICADNKFFFILAVISGKIFTFAAKYK